MANVTPTIWNSELSTLRTRLGDLRDNQTAQDGVWGKYIGSRNRISTSNVGYTQDMNGLMLGGDHAIALENGRLLVGECSPIPIQNWMPAPVTARWTA